MNKNIVIFGCDNSGKTTLSSNIVEYLNKNGIDVEYQHSLGPNVTIEQQKEFMENNLAKDVVTVFDRFPFIEEGVCGTILRGVNAFDTGDEEIDTQYEKELLGKVDLFILCYPGLFEVINWGEREQMFGIKENIVNLIKGYNMVAVNLKNIGYPIKEYNFKCDNFEELIKEVI